jgi:hypothetical protein
MVVRLMIPPARQKLFGFLLESVEGLGTHTRVESMDALDIQVPESQLGEFEEFLSYWQAFDGNITPPGTDNSIEKAGL